MLLDEPFSALDAGLRATTRRAVAQLLTDAGVTTLLVTHDQEEALSLADLVAVMRDGAIVQADDPQTLYREPVDAQLAGFLGDAVLLTGELADGHVDTPLGRLAVRGAQQPGVTRANVMLRPEQILCREPLDGAPRGHVLATQFFGHDATARVSLADPACPQITARAAGHRLPAVGDEVSLVVEGTALAYPV
jgi:iron(III) transport system ATP-binding protein